MFKIRLNRLKIARFGLKICFRIQRRNLTQNLPQNPLRKPQSWNPSTESQKPESLHIHLKPLCDVAANGIFKLDSTDKVAILGFLEQGNRTIAEFT